MEALDNILQLLKSWRQRGVASPEDLFPSPADKALFWAGAGDSTKGIKTLRELADNGDIQAQIFLGDLYHDGGFGIPKDYQESMRWYHSVADHGVAIGQYDLGRGYFIGEGIPRNATEALRLYRLAADQGWREGSSSSGVKLIATQISMG